jgi:putative membrane protein
MVRLILQIIAAIISLFLASEFVPGVSFHFVAGQSNFFGIKISEFWQILFLTGAVLGLINFFVKPVLNLITLPLRFLTFGFFSLVINMLLIWLVDVFFRDLLEIKGIIPLFWTAIIFWFATFILGIYKKKI